MHETCYTLASMAAILLSTILLYSREILVFSFMSFLLLRSLCLFIFDLRFFIVLAMLRRDTNSEDLPIAIDESVR